jgi:4-aminobutyrate aminotransferase-like enzyme
MSLCKRLKEAGILIIFDEVMTGFYRTGEMFSASLLDISPDFIPIIGQIDDVLLLSLFVSEVSSLVLDGWKAKKGTVENSTSNPANHAPAAGETVDVDSIPVK